MLIEYHKKLIIPDQTQGLKYWRKKVQWHPTSNTTTLYASQIWFIGYPHVPRFYWNINTTPIPTPPIPLNPLCQGNQGGKSSVQNPRLPPVSLISTHWTNKTNIINTSTYNTSSANGPHLHQKNSQTTPYNPGIESSNSQSHPSQIHHKEPHTLHTLNQ